MSIQSGINGVDAMGIEEEVAQLRVDVESVKGRQTGHEQVCQYRYEGINKKLDLISGGMVAIFLAVLGWALVQLYLLEPARVAQQLLQIQAMKGH